MSLSIYLAIAWVFGATIVAMLPMPRQFVPGSILLCAAPFLIGYIGYDHGWVAAIAALAAVLSMFRKPLRYYWRKWRGHENEVAK